jgi:hypothetical protein
MKPWEGRCRVLYGGTKLWTPGVNYSLATSTAYPFTTDSITIINTERQKGDTTKLLTGDYLVVEVGYLPGGGYQ